ncbi:TPA: sodium:solute symporter family protein, partial [Candidatus Poribacteria bacterium]|nr:sodium:solute symporter family protein [Candidatus Poribacteria bacterium]
MTEILPFGPAALTVIFLYILSLIGIGWIGYRAREDNSMKDFYLAGRGFGFLVLLLTLYATQYSGNTLFGFTGKTYRIGFSWVMSLHFMTAIIVCYLIFAPKLYHRAKQKGFITPVDFLDDRFRSNAISLIAAFVMIVALINYALAQLMAMGRAFQGLVSINPVQAYIYGVIFLAIIMGIYETLGGLRAVAWTDVIQGLILMCGFAIMLVLVFSKYGSIGIATEQIFRNADPEIVKKAMPPDWQRVREWLSYILVVGLGGALYPQAIQRIYAARSETVLRRSLTVMAFLPLTTTLIALIVGVMAIAHHPGLKGAQADQILMIICRQVQAGSTFGYWLVVLLFAAVLAAIMS